MIETKKASLVDKLKLSYQSIIEKGCNKYGCEYGIKNLSEEISKKYVLNRVLDQEYMQSLSDMQNGKGDLEKHIELDKKDMLRTVMAGARLGLAGHLISIAPELTLQPSGISINELSTLGCYLGVGWAAVDTTISAIYHTRLRSKLKSTDS